MRPKLAPVHPGEILMEDYLVPLGLSRHRLAQDLSVPPRRINEIVHGKRAVTADTALRLARYFGTSEQFWLNLQSRYDLEVERDRLGARLEEEVAVFTYSPADRLGVSRSEQYAVALSDFVAKHSETEITERLDRVYATETGALDARLRRAQPRSLGSDDW